MDRYQRRVLKLREHVLSQQVSRDTKEELYNEELIQDIDVAHGLAIKEDFIRCLEDKTVTELKAMAKERELKGYKNMKKEELIKLLEGAE